MKKEYTIKGLDCQNCATKLMEKGIKEDYINYIDINFVMGKLKLETSDEKKAIEFLKKEEEGILIEEINHHEHNHDEESSNLLIIKLILSFIVVAISFLIKNENISNFILFIAYIIIGYEVILKALKNLLKGNLFDEFFLMFIATFAALLIGENLEAVLVMYFYMLGEFLQSKAINNSRKSIKDLLEGQIKDVELNNGEIKEPKNLVKGDIIKAKVGQKIPVDCLATSDVYVDTSALTGESVPRKYKKGDLILAGMILKESSSILKVENTYQNSAIAKMIKLVEDANDKKSNTELFITKFAKIYTPLVVILALIVALVLPLFGFTFYDSIYRAVILLVISCPCALVISVPLGYFTTIGSSTSKGVLIKGATLVDTLNKIDTLVLDKTGTLTKGNFEVSNFTNFSNYSDEEIFFITALGESKSTHPIAKSIMSYYKKNYNRDIKDISIKEIEGKGLKYKFENKEVLVGKKDLLEEENISIKKSNLEGTSIFVSYNKEHVLTINISDQIKEDSFLALEQLKKQGIKEIIMLTGDNELVAKEVALKLNIKKYYANLLPNDKLSILKEIKNDNNTVAFIGDGINDVPVISYADLGIAMGNLGSDITIENADIILNNDSLLGLSKSKKSANKGLKIIKQNIIFAIIIKVLFLILGIFGIATMFEAIFTDVGVTILAILNTLRILKD